MTRDYWLRKTPRARKHFWWHVYKGPEKLVSLPTRQRALNYITRHQIRTTTLAPLQGRFANVPRGTVFLTNVI